MEVARAEVFEDELGHVDQVEDGMPAPGLLRLEAFEGVACPVGHEPQVGSPSDERQRQKSQPSAAATRRVRLDGQQTVREPGSPGYAPVPNGGDHGMPQQPNPDGEHRKDADGPTERQQQGSECRRPPPVFLKSAPEAHQEHEEHAFAVAELQEQIAGMDRHEEDQPERPGRVVPEGHGPVHQGQAQRGQQVGQHQPAPHRRRAQGDDSAPEQGPQRVERAGSHSLGIALRG